MVKMGQNACRCRRAHGKLAAKHRFDVSKLKYKVKVYLLHGEAPFADEQEKRVYTREEKLKAI